MKPYKVLIVEDEYPARELLIRFLVKRPELHLQGVANDGQQALAELQKGAYDIVFLDIDLPLLTGLEMLERLETRPFVIFTTAHRQYALDAFEMEAVAYLLKPYDEARFARAVERALALLKSDRTDRPALGGHGIFVSDQDEHLFVPYDRILYVASHGKQTVVHTPVGDYRTPRLLKVMEELLPADRFLRIHKQFIVNLTKIGRLEYFMNGSYVLHLNDDSEELPVSRNYAPELKRRCGL